MVFRSENKEHTVKGILISAPSCAGKSHLLKSTSKHTHFSGTRIFEMDSLEYYEADKLKAQLPEAKKNLGLGLICKKKHPFKKASSQY